MANSINNTSFRKNTEDKPHLWMPDEINKVISDIKRKRPDVWHELFKFVCVKEDLSSLKWFDHDHVTRNLLWKSYPNVRSIDIDSLFECIYQSLCEEVHAAYPDKPKINPIKNDKRETLRQWTQEEINAAVHTIKTMHPESWQNLIITELTSGDFGGSLAALDISGTIELMYAAGNFWDANQLCGHIFDAMREDAYGHNVQFHQWTTDEVQTAIDHIKQNHPKAWIELFESEKCNGYIEYQADNIINILSKELYLDAEHIDIIRLLKPIRDILQEEIGPVLPPDKSHTTDNKYKHEKLITIILVIIMLIIFLMSKSILKRTPHNPLQDTTLILTIYTSESASGNPINGKTFLNIANTS